MGLLIYYLFIKFNYFTHNIYNIDSKYSIYSTRHAHAHKCSYIYSSDTQMISKVDLKKWV